MQFKKLELYTTSNNVCSFQKKHLPYNKKNASILPYHKKKKKTGKDHR